jgi:hypothetical protein
VAAADLTGVNYPRARETEKTVAVVVDLGMEEAICGGKRKGRTSLPIRGAAEEMPTPVPDLVDVFRRDVEICQIEHDVVAGIFGILDSTENRVGTAAEHDLERPEVCMPFVAPREKNDQHGGRKFDEKDSSDEAESDAGAARHEEGSGERR